MVLIVTIETDGKSVKRSQRARPPTTPKGAEVTVEVCGSPRHLFLADIHEIGMFPKNRLALHEAHGTHMFFHVPSVSRVDLPGHGSPKASSHTAFPGPTVTLSAGG